MRQSYRCPAVRRIDLARARGCAMADIVEVLRKSFSLDGLEPDLAERLFALAHTIDGKPGSILFQAGDPGNGCYLILEARMVINRSRSLLIVRAAIMPGTAQAKLDKSGMKARPLSPTRNISSSISTAARAI